MQNNLNQTKNSLFSIIKRLWSHFEKKRKKQFVILFFIMIIASFAEVLSIGAVLPFLAVLSNPTKVFHNPILYSTFYYFKIKNAQEIILPFTILFGIAVVLSGFFRMLLLWVQTKISHKIGTDLSLSVYKKTLYQPYSVHVMRNSSELISGISNKVQSIIYSALLPILILISSIFLLLIIISALFFINSQIAILSMAGFSLIYIIIIKITKKRIATDSKKISIESNNVVKALQEGLGGIRDVLIDGTQKTYCEIYKKADLPLRNAQANVIIISGFPRFTIEALGMVLIAVLAYSMSLKINGLVMAIPTIGALALGSQRMLPILQQAYTSWISFKGAESSLIDALELLDQPLPDNSEDVKTKKLNFNLSICLKNISFKYTNSSPLVLNNLYISIEKGSKVGFIGSTGSGKSTLLDIIMGLLTPTTGKFLVDDIEINEFNCRSWQSNIAHVPQSIYLADSTIIENIAFGIPFDEIDIHKVYHSAKVAQIHEAIISMDKQYNTFVGERGVRLSGGQRQRIGIARAIYKNANVLVFDEATSALDNNTEKNVMNEIDNFSNDITILIVAHRLTTLSKCSKIFELSSGKIIKEGTYNEIIQN